MPKGNILVIDDEAVILDVASDILKRVDYQVTTAGSGEQGYEKLKRGNFVLVITDIKMPGLSGISLIEKIRKDVSTELPIIVITGHGTVDIAIESLKHGTQGFLMKPFTPAELIEAVEDAIRRSNIMKENIRLKAFIPLFEVNKKLLSEVNITRLLQMIVEEASKYTGADRISMMLVGEDGYLTKMASIGIPQDSREPVRIKPGEGIAGWVAEKKEPLLLNDGMSIHPDLKDLMIKQEIRSALCMPIIVKGNLLGVLNLAKLKDINPFTNSDRELVSVLCGQVGVAIENARLYERLKGSYMGIIATLASAIEARDPYTAGHAIRMAEYSWSIALEMDVSSQEIDTVQKAALLHDIGKIGIPDHILLKKGSLSEEEYHIMKDHPLIGSRILDNMNGFEHVSIMVKHHHEHFDGNGIPSGLKGKEIPLVARIIAVADAFEAMTSVRPYRRAIAPVEAVEELKRVAGSQFDPEVVEAFIKVLKRKEII